VPLDDNIQRKVTFSDNLDVQMWTYNKEKSPPPLQGMGKLI
jgi:hypothetical protein